MECFSSQSLKKCLKLRIFVFIIICVTIPIFAASVQASTVITVPVIQQTDVSAGTSESKSNVNLKLNSQSAVLMDAETGRILYGKGEDLIRPMASTTKIMTCILALEYGHLDDTVTVSSYAAHQPEVHLGAPTGKQFRLGDLLYSLMLESHNDTAVMIAEHIGGSVSGFADMMNQKARELGCQNTWYITPNGLDATETLEDGVQKNHSTTAEDLARIMEYCTWESPKSEEFLTITRTQNYYFTDLEGKGSYSCTNHNALLSMMSGAVSGKTGFTNGAGYCYVAAFEDNGRKYTLALLGCGWPPHKTYKWTDARKLLEYGMSAFEKKNVFSEPQLSEIPVMNGIAEDGDLSSQAHVDLTLDLNDDEKILEVLMGEEEEISMTMEVPDNIKAPVQKGMEVGQVVYSLGDTVIKRYPIYAVDSVPEITQKWCLEKILNIFMITD